VVSRSNAKSHILLLLCSMGVVGERENNNVKKCEHDAPAMTTSDDGSERVVEYRDLLSKLSPDEAFFEMANCPVVSFQIAEDDFHSSTVFHPEKSRTTTTTTTTTSSSSSNARMIHVEQKQELENSCGGIVWESAFALAEYLRKTVFEKKKKKKNATKTTLLRDCIDIGAGTGFLGIWVHKVAKMQRTVLTDTMKCFDLMRRNVERNFSSNDDDDDDERSHATIDVKPLDWTSKQDLDALTTTGRGKFDLLVATDVIFAERLVEPLILCLKTLIDPERGVCYVCAQPRDKAAFELFQDLCAKEFREFRKVPKEELDFSFDAECELFEMRL
jgi:predicted nicotinamide N-methyase